MADSAAPVVVALPLQGEGWVAVNSPADRIPSHGRSWAEASDRQPMA